MEKKRTQEELVQEAFRLLIARGEATPHEAVVPMGTGGVFTKKFYKINEVHTTLHPSTDERLKHADRSMSRNKDYQRLLNSPRWAKVKAIVKARAGGLCERCKEEGFITPGVDCHHIVPVESGKHKSLKEMERLCYDVNNIRLLCIDCHIKTHREMRSHEGQIMKTLPKDDKQNDHLRQWLSRVSNNPVDESQFKTVKKGIRKTRFGWVTKEEYQQKLKEEQDAWIRRQGNGLNNAQAKTGVDAQPED